MTQTMDYPITPIEQVEFDPATGMALQVAGDGWSLPFQGGGCEFGDWYGFFSQEKNGGTNVDILEKNIRIGMNEVEGSFLVGLPCGVFEIGFRETVEEGRLLRSYVLTSRQEALIGDFVVRMGMSSEYMPTGIIDKQYCTHGRHNVMRQLPVRSAGLAEKRLQVLSELVDVEASDRLGVYTYLRDCPSGRWIIHHRLLTESADSDEYVLRIRHAAYSSRRHAWVSPLRFLLWRSAERRSWIRPTIQVGGNIRMAAGEKWRLVARMSVHSVIYQF